MSLHEIPRHFFYEYLIQKTLALHGAPEYHMAHAKAFSPDLFAELVLLDIRTYRFIRSPKWGSLDPTDKSKKRIECGIRYQLIAVANKQI